MKHELRFTVRTDAPGESAAKAAARLLEQSGLFGYSLASARQSDVYSDVLVVTIVSRSNDVQADRETRAFYQQILFDAFNRFTKARFIALESSRFIGSDGSLTKEVSRRLDGAVEGKARELKGR